MDERRNRRSFLRSSVSAGSLLLANRLFGAPASDSNQPASALETLGDVALRAAKKQGASYADLRIGRHRNQFSGYRLSPQRGSNITDEVPFVTDQNTFGFGVRVIVNGQWGFAASPLVTAEEIARITRDAVVVAKANASAQAAVKELIDARRQEKAVLAVETFQIGGIAPRLAVAGDQVHRIRDAGDPTLTFDRHDAIFDPGLNAMFSILEIVVGLQWCVNRNGDHQVPSFDTDQPN